MSGRSFAIIDVTSWQVRMDEPMGSKRKKWLFEPDTGVAWLFKYRRRPDSGEDWAEKIAAEVAAVLGLPHATVELAVCQGDPGVIVKNFLMDERETLAHGNELIPAFSPDYQAALRFKAIGHTVELAHQVISRFDVPRGFESRAAMTATSVFAGYLLLDALIANCDRHHENWAVIHTSPAANGGALSPTFDHASSLGRNLTDREREARLRTRDKGGDIRAWTQRARSAWYSPADNSRSLSMIDAWERSSALEPAAGTFWRGRLSSCSAEVLGDIVHRIPASLMSIVAKDFALRMMEENKLRLPS